MVNTMDAPSTPAAPEVKKTKITFDLDVYLALKAYVRSESARIAPARVDMTGVVNAAVSEYIERRGASVELERERVTA